MKIIVNIKLLLNDRSGNSSYFPGNTLHELINKKPEHEFIIITDQAHAKTFSTGKNVSLVTVSNSHYHPLIWKWWHDLKLPVILKKYKADVFVSFNGFCSLTTSVPQCIMLHDLSFLYDASPVKRSHLFFYNRYLPKFLQKANAVVSSSSFLKTEITNRYKINTEKIEVVHAAPGEIFHPLSEMEKEKIRIKYSNGKNYFIAATAPGSDKNLITLLKAFSVFKKMQKSNWRLVLIEERQSANKKINETLRTYKYRDDVLLAGKLTDEEFVMLLGSAYALIDSSLWNGINTIGLNAMKCHVPVITFDNPAGREVYGEAALYADPAAHKDIADKMMMLYKDETRCSSLAEKGKAAVAGKRVEKSASLLWKCILKAYMTTGKPLQ